MLLGEDDSALKVAQQIKFHGLVGYRQKWKRNIMNEKISTSFWGDVKETEHYFKKAVSYKNNDCYLIWVPIKRILVIVFTFGCRITFYTNISGRCSIYLTKINLQVCKIIVGRNLCWRSNCKISGKYSLY